MGKPKRSRARSSGETGAPEAPGRGDALRWVGRQLAWERWIDATRDDGVTDVEAPIRSDV